LTFSSRETDRLAAFLLAGASAIKSRRDATPSFANRAPSHIGIAAALRKMSRPTPGDDDSGNDEGSHGMKLAEALILRADAQKRIEQLKQRLLRNAKVQEGDAPAENPRDLLQELEEVAATLTRLIRQINRTNAQTTLADGTTVSDALARRDVLAKQHAVYRDLAATATVEQARYSRSEVKFVSTVDVAAIQRRADDLARQYRELDATIQATNWSADLIED
jgi:hypothetical protein